MDQNDIRTKTIIQNNLCKIHVVGAFNSWYQTIMIIIFMINSLKVPDSIVYGTRLFGHLELSNL